MSDLFSLEGTVAIVTGGSRGIGKMIAAGFLRHGAKRVYITARKAEVCDAAAKELSQLGECVSLPANISTLAGIEAFASAFLARETELHILVNNAGASWGAPFDDFPEDGWNKVVDLNMKTPFYLTQKLHGALKNGAATRGRLSKVINISSMDAIAVQPAHENYPYTASKAGLAHMTKQMALRLIKDDIVVTGVAPGAFVSDMNREARDAPDTIIPRIPARRIGGDNDAAGVTVFLASVAGDYVVGQSIVVDGGSSLTRLY